MAMRRAIEADRLFFSILLWGPPGKGETTLTQIIANQTKSGAMRNIACYPVGGAGHAYMLR